MKTYLYDIECFKNVFILGIEDYHTKKKHCFEVSEERDDRNHIYKFCKTYKGFLVSFNGEYYDQVVMGYIHENWKKLKDLPKTEFTMNIKKMSDIIIEDRYLEYAPYKWWKKPWTSIDLFCFWSKETRLSKKISLKGLAIQLKYPIIQELPFKPDSLINKEDLEKLRTYNIEHDLGVLRMLYDALKEEIELRENIVSEQGIHCWSMDAPKIASEALLKNYCKLKNKKPSEIKNLRFEKETLYLNKVLDGFEPDFSLPIFKNLYKEILESKDYFSKDLIVNHNNTNIVLTYGIGGLHAINENEQYATDDKYQLITSDFASLYPNLIINYKTIRFEEVLKIYYQTKEDRIEAKRTKQKTKDKFLKLILNSVSGLLDNEHSWLYYPEGAMKLRLIGQLILTKCIEACILKNWKVLSANTDGIEVLIPHDEINEYKTILEKVARSFNLDLEHDLYKKIVYKNVNSYIAITESGSVKRKGLFKIEFDEKGNREIPLGDSVNELVVAKALNLFYIKGIPPEESIKNPDKYGFHIYDYCVSKKIHKNYEIIWNQEKQQQLNRYYFSKSSPYLYKKKNSKQILENVHVGFGVELFNNYVEKTWKDYDINYGYYTHKANNIVSQLNNFNQLKLEF